MAKYKQKLSSIGGEKWELVGIICLSSRDYHLGVLNSFIYILRDCGAISGMSSKQVRKISNKIPPLVLTSSISKKFPFLLPLGDFNSKCFAIYKLTQRKTIGKCKAFIAQLMNFKLPLYIL